MPMLELGEWQMIMRGPDGDEYPIAAGQLPASIIPDPNDDSKSVLTVELAQFVRGLGDQIEELALAGEIPDMMASHDVDDIYSQPQDPPCR
jgi:hypothetical protein